MRKLIGITLLALTAAACAEGTRPGTAPSTPATGSPAATETATTEVSVYYLVAGGKRGYITKERHRVTATPAIARAALEEMVHGTPQDPDHTSPFPRAARINSVTITDSVATVDWSAEVLEASVGAEAEELGIQSAVYTLTEFPTITRVRFTVEGKTSGNASNGRRIEDWWGHVGLARQPFGRADRLRVVAPVVLLAPLEGSRPSGSITLTGEACTFEANVGIKLLDGTGKVLVQTSTTAREACPAGGPFTETIRYTAAPGTALVLQAFESSAEDGSIVVMETRNLIAA